MLLFYPRRLFLATTSHSHAHPHSMSTARSMHSVTTLGSPERSTKNISDKHFIDSLLRCPGFKISTQLLHLCLTLCRRQRLEAGKLRF